MNAGVMGRPRTYLNAASEVSVRVARNEDGCLIYTGTLDTDGYGRLKGDSGASVSAHRVAYATAHGAIPAGLEIDHRCRNRACVNPEHLEAVTHTENVRRAMRDQCRNGHPYTDTTTRTSAVGARICRLCNLAAVKRYQARKSVAR